MVRVVGWHSRDQYRLRETTKRSAIRFFIISRSPITGRHCLLHTMNRPTSTLRLVLSTTQSRFTPSPAVLRPFVSSARLYATHHETASPHSQSQATSDLLKGLGSKTGTSSGTQDTVGPFPLGVGPNGRRKTWKSWSDLNIGGKRKHRSCNSKASRLKRITVVRTTQQTGNLTVIFFGGALFVVLTFALTTELFAKNSPSVLYSHAIDMIRGSNAVRLINVFILSFIDNLQA